MEMQKGSEFSWLSFSAISNRRLYEVIPVCKVEILQVTVNKIEVFHLLRLISGDFQLKVLKIAKNGTLVSCWCS